MGRGCFNRERKMTEEALAWAQEPAKTLPLRSAAELELRRVVNDQNAGLRRSPLGRRDEVRLENRLRLDSTVAEEPIRGLELGLVRQRLREALRRSLRELVPQPIEPPVQPPVGKLRPDKLLRQRPKPWH